MRVLVIRHGALGDIVLTFPAFEAIRRAHAGDVVVLLTTAGFAGFLEKSPWFDEVMVDAKPEAWDLPGLMALRRQLRGFDVVYDLQTSSRSARYFALAGKPRWSGISAGCCWPHDNPKRDFLHSRERIAEQLAKAGVKVAGAPNLSWLRGGVERFRLPAKYAVLVPGASAHRPEKRWPEQKFGALAVRLAMPAVVLGGKDEAPLAAVIRSFTQRALDLTGKTDLSELAGVVAGAVLAVGNDTGPMHLAAALSVPSVVLFSGASDPALTCPRYPDGGWPSVLQAPHLSGVSVAQVVAALP